MAEELNQEYVDNLSNMDSAMPGSSLTNDPDTPLPFEGQPEYTDAREAAEYIFQFVTKEENYIPIMQAVGDGYPLMDLTQAMLFQGFSEGKWNPDLLMILAEPTAYILMALAERAGIDFVIYRGEADDEEEEEELLGIKYDEERLNELREAKKTKEIPEGIIPKEIERRLDEAPVESLLAAQNVPNEDTEETKQPQSLMASPIS